MAHLDIKLKIIIGCFIIASAVVLWETIGIDELTRLSSHYTLYLEFDGKDQVFDPITGKLSEPFDLKETQLRKVISVQGNVVEVESNTVGKNIDSQQNIFDAKDVFFVDKITKQHVKNHDGYFVFPTHVQKQNYEFFNPLVLAPATFVFEKEDTKNDLPVYLFSCKFAKNDISYAFPQFTTKKILNDGSCNFWVEPITGKLIDFEMNWDNYFFEDGVKRVQVEKGNKHISPDVVFVLTQDAIVTKDLYFIYEVAIPAVIVIIGSILFLITLMNLKSTKQTKIILQSQSNITKQLDELNSTKIDLNKALLSNKISKRLIEEQLKELQESDKQKDEFASMISHELRTPLVPIKGYCEMLKDSEMSKNLTPDQIEFINEIYDNSERLESLIDEILDVQKIALGQMKFHNIPLNLKEFFVKITNDSSPLFTEKQIRLEVTRLEVTIDADSNRLHQVFDNLIRNAVDFVSHNTGVIEIGAKSQNDHVLFYVKDNGIGIPKNKQGNLFKKFYQVDTSHTRKHGGTGLGLVVCKGIIEGMNGKIWIESDEGKGTKFYFTLPKNNLQN